MKQVIKKFIGGLLLVAIFFVHLNIFAGEEKVNILFTWKTNLQENIKEYVIYNTVLDTNSFNYTSHLKEIGRTTNNYYTITNVTLLPKEVIKLFIVIAVDTNNVESFPSRTLAYSPHVPFTPTSVDGFSNYIYTNYTVDLSKIDYLDVPYEPSISPTMPKR